MDQNEYLNRLVEEFTKKQGNSESEKNEFIKILKLLMVVDEKENSEIEIINLITNQNDK